MMMQDPILGRAVVPLPIQLAIVPRLQRRINQLARRRVKEVRTLGGLIVEPDADQTEDDGPIVDSLNRIKDIRFDIHQRKFFMISLKNFISHLTPSLFYAIGGYLVTQDRLTLGTLVAVIAVHKDFTPPLKELFGYYQVMEDVCVRYEEIRRFLATGPIWNRDRAGPSAARTRTFSPVRPSVGKLDAVGDLQLAHELDDLLQRALAYLRLGRHVAKTPVMLRHATFGRENESGIGVMARLIDLVHQRRALIGAAGKVTVAGCTGLGKGFLPGRCLARKLGQNDVDRTAARTIRAEPPKPDKEQEGRSEDPHARGWFDRFACHNAASISRK